MTTERSALPWDAEWVAAAGLVLAVSMATWISLSHTHGWGDDFAGYLMQAHAMANGSMRDELSIGTHLLSLSDSKFGPPAYPWGYPALLWLGSLVVGWDINALKLVAVLSNGLLGASLYLIGRHYVSRAGSLFVAAFVTLQPTVLGAADSLTSDLPGLAVAAFALLLAEFLANAPANPQRMRPALVLCAAIVATAAFSIRSNGAFVAVSMFSVLAWPLLFGPREGRRARLVEAVALTAITSALFLAYLRFLPDGSLAHAGYLSLAPKELVRRLVETISTTADFVPFSLLRAVGLFNPVTVVLVGAVGALVCGVGIVRHRDRAIGLVAFFVLNFALLLTFPDNGGPRYLFPLLIPAAVFLAAGTEQLAQRRLVGAVREREAVHSARINRVAGGATAVVIVAGLFLAFRGLDRSAPGGPLTPVADSLFSWVRDSVPSGAPVSFFKPRALRYFTEKQGIAITQPENLGRAPFVIFDKRAEDGRWEKTWQVDRTALESFEGGRFTKAYENGQFIVYRGRTP